MSAPETHQPFEQKSSVQLSKNAKGEMQQVVKVYEGVDPIEVDRLVRLALATYAQLDSEGGHAG